jgi:O-antigen/teichoic acid export membrane protein
MSLSQTNINRFHRAVGGVFVRNLSSAVIVQAVLSAGNLAVGLILIRFASDAQYGYYVLVANALLLITAAQTQFIGPAMIERLTRLGKSDRSSFISGLYRDQRRLLPIFGSIAAVVTAGMWIAGTLTTHTALLVFAAIVAALANLYREFFRMVLLAYRLPTDVLRVDTVYVVALVLGAAISTFFPVAATITVMILFAAALGSGILLARALRRHEPWNMPAASGVLRRLAPIGAWTAAGGIIHWSFSQGYNYLIVGTLDVNAVAAVAATRLLMMPVNMLSTGIGSLMLPTASAWLLEHRPGVVFRRLVLLCFGLAGIALCYLGVVWIFRDLIFTDVLHKKFAQRDLLLVLWSVIFLLMIFRDQLLFLPLARARYRSLTVMTFCCAVTSLVVSYFSILHIGVAGALVGVLTGEFISVAGLIGMSLIEINRDAPIQV